MAGAYLAKIVFTRNNGIPKDAVSNNLVFAPLQLTDELDFAVIEAAMQDFWVDGYGGAGSDVNADEFGKIISTLVNRAFSIKLYDITDKLGYNEPDEDHPNRWLTPAGSPVHEFSLTLAGNPNGAHPAEVACVGSFHGDLAGLTEESGTTRPKARRRGRMYLGPLSNQVQVGTNTGGDLRPTITLRTFINAKMEQLAGNGDANWCVWSRETGQLHSVTGGWCDDAFDTVRSRGVARLNRNSWGSNP